MIEPSTVAAGDDDSNTAPEWITRWLRPGDLFRNEPLTDGQVGIELFDGSIYVDNRAGLAALGHAIVQHHRYGDDPDQLYVVRDDLHAPDHYDLVSLGDIGARVPGYALVEIDPARARLLPAPQGALPYPPGLDDDTDS